MDHYDLLVIGSGPAGEKGAAQAAYFGRRVALVERAARPGGAPVNSGGLPTKTLREAALYLTSYRRREIYGVGLALAPEITLERMKARAETVSALAGEFVRENLARHDITVHRGVARLGPGRSVIVEREGGQEHSLHADRILIATGSRPYRPPDIPFDDPDVHDSDTILGLDRLPSSLVVIGGGPVGCEYASIFAALGVQVSLVDRGTRMMPFLDAEISDELAACLTSMGVRLVLGSSRAKVSREDGRLRVELSNDEDMSPDKVLYAAGRSGNTESLALADAGVQDR